MFKKIPYDKRLHFLAGLGCSLLFGVIINTLVGFISGIVIGILKEIYDFYDYGKFDCYDMFATWIGAIVGASIVWLLWNVHL